MFWLIIALKWWIIGLFCLKWWNICMKMVFLVCFSVIYVISISLLNPYEWFQFSPSFFHFLWSNIYISVKLVHHFLLLIDLKSCNLTALQANCQVSCSPGFARAVLRVTRNESRVVRSLILRLLPSRDSFLVTCCPFASKHLAVFAGILPGTLRLRKGELRSLWASRAPSEPEML